MVTQVCSQKYLTPFFDPLDYIICQFILKIILIIIFLNSIMYYCHNKYMT